MVILKMEFMHNCELWIQKMFSVFPKKKKLVGENSKKSLIFKVEETFGIFGKDIDVRFQQTTEHETFFCFIF